MYCSSDSKWTSSVVALARNLDILGSRFLTGLTAVLVASLHQALTGQMCTFSLLNRRHHLFVLLDLPSFVLLDLLSFQHPADQCSYGDANRERRRNS